MHGNSRQIISNQSGPHENLKALVEKHLNCIYQEPIRPFNKETFERVNAHFQASEKPLILDSGCGTGESTIQLANRFPDHLVIGIDKSIKRLGPRGIEDNCLKESNWILVRADLVDFWRLAVAANWQPDKHYLLYPNPWPKKKHLGRRWHGHAVFPCLLKLAGQLELRSNWQIYVEEFALALKTAGIDKEITLSAVQENTPFSPFEKKYKQSGHGLFSLKTRL